MGVIQGSINNLLTSAGAFASLFPSSHEKVKERAALKSLKTEETLVQRREKLGSVTMQEAASEKASIAEQRAVLRPTKKNIEAAYDRATESRELDLKAEQRKKMEQKAAEDLKIKQEEKQRSEEFRRKFLEDVPVRDTLAKERFIKEGK